MGQWEVLPLAIGFRLRLWTTVPLGYESHTISRPIAFEISLPKIESRM